MTVFLSVGETLFTGAGSPGERLMRAGEEIILEKDVRHRVSMTLATLAEGGHARDPDEQKIASDAQRFTSGPAALWGIPCP